MDDNKIDELSDNAWRAVVEAQSHQLLEQVEQIRDLFDIVHGLQACAEDHRNEILHLRRTLDHARMKDPDLSARIAEYQQKLLSEMGNHWDPMRLQSVTGRNIGKTKATSTLSHYLDDYLAQFMAAEVKKPGKIVGINVC